jgi:hypothetical protein
MSKVVNAMVVAGCVATASMPATAANLLVNGGFEDSSSQTLTPTGWFNIGAANGVLTYSDIPMQPVYEGLRFYDLGAHNNGIASVGEGLGQTFASVVGATYRLTFGLSGENLGTSVETVRVSAGDALMDYALTPTGTGVFTRAFMAETFLFDATGVTTTLSFVLQSIAGAAGNNDPMFDGVSVELVSVPVLPVPEPESWALMLAGLGVVGALQRRRART